MKHQNIDRMSMWMLIMQSKVFHQSPFCKHWHPKANHTVIKRSPQFSLRLSTSAKTLRMIKRVMLFSFSILIDIHQSMNEISL